MWGLMLIYDYHPVNMQTCGAQIGLCLLLKISNIVL